MVDGKHILSVSEALPPGEYEIERYPTLRGAKCSMYKVTGYDVYIRILRKRSARNGR